MRKSALESPVWSGCQQTVGLVRSAGSSSGSMGCCPVSPCITFNQERRLAFELQRGRLVARDWVERQGFGFAPASAPSLRRPSASTRPCTLSHGLCSHPCGAALANPTGSRNYASACLGRTGYDTHTLSVRSVTLDTLKARTHTHRRRRPANAGQRYPAEILTPDEVRGLIKACSNRALTGIRNRALLVLLYRAGCRISEALRLLPKDLDRANGTASVLRGKGGTRRTIGRSCGSSWEALASEPLGLGGLKSLRVSHRVVFPVAGRERESPLYRGLDRDFGRFERWRRDFVAVGACAAWGGRCSTRMPRTAG